MAFTEPMTFANSIVKVQPMSKPVGNAFAMRFQYKEMNPFPEFDMICELE